jgi:hypothetical protein
MAILNWFACSKVASKVVGVSGFTSTDIYHFNRHRVYEYLFSISDTSETKISVEIAPPNTAIVCVTSIYEQTLIIFYQSQQNLINSSEYSTSF